MIINPYSYATGSWTPLSLGAALIAWGDPTNAATVTLDGSGKVSQVDDLSGNGLHWTRSDASTRGGYAGSAPNGANVVTTSGGARLDWLHNHNQPITMITAFRNSNAGAYVYDGYSGRIALAFFNVAANTNTNKLTAWAGSGVGNDAASDSINTDIVACATYDGASSELRRNGTVLGTGSIGSNNITAGLAYMSSIVDMHGWLGQMILVAGTMMLADKVNAEAFCRSKLGF